MSIQPRTSQLNFALGPACRLAGGGQGCVEGFRGRPGVCTGRASELPSDPPTRNEIAVGIWEIVAMLAQGRWQWSCMGSNNSAEPIQDVFHFSPHLFVTRAILSVVRFLFLSELRSRHVSSPENQDLRNGFAMSLGESEWLR